MVKKTYKINGMHCTSCALMIESNLEDLGVKVKCSFSKEELEVEFDPEKIKEEKIKEVVKNTGYELIN